MNAPEINFDSTAKALRKIKPLKTPVFGELEKNILYTFSGKSAISLVLRYFRSQNALRDRTDQLLVPGGLGIPVYNTINKSCFPTTFFNKKVQGVLAYHQWGYPQNMDAIRQFCDEKKLFLIEDCAHAFESYYRGERVGTMGEVAIFSLAKFFPSVVGGAIYTKNESMRRFVTEAFRSDEKNLAKKVFVRRLAIDCSPTKQNLIELERNYAIYDLLLACPAYSLAVARNEIAHGAIERRKHIHERYRAVFGGDAYPSSLADENVIPWVMPLFFETGQCKKVVAALRKKNIKSDIYHFDVNRNMLEPRFAPCVPLPCHQGMSGEDVDLIIATVQKAL